MTVGEDIFPDGCQIAYFGDKLSPLAKMFLREQRFSEQGGNGVEHPCYSCLADCGARKVEYHDEDNRFAIKPKRPTQKLQF